jgi:hypothetical protein
MHTRELALTISLLGLLAGTARADIFTLTCGEPSQPGTITVVGSAQFGVETLATSVAIPGTYTAEQKCAAIAAAVGPGSTVSGNVITFTDLVLGGYNLTGLFVDGDTTFESTTISAQEPPGYLANLVVVPNASPTIFPAVGTVFSGSLSAPSFGTITFSTTANGTESEVTLQTQLLSEITADTGLTFSTVLITPTQTGFASSLFDPSSVNITWDGNTGADLATFGLELVGPEPGTSVTPEPRLMALTGLGFVGLAFVAYRRRRTV